MIKILVQSQVFEDACSWYRVMPMKELETHSDDFRVHVHQDKTAGWSDYKGHDIAFFFRPFSKLTFQQINVALDMNLKVWLDFDDDLFNIPMANPAYKTASDPEHRAFAAKAIQLAHQITVSTAALKEVYAHLNQNIEVVPNATDLDQFYFRGDIKPKKLIFWRGSRTHDSDLMEYLDEMVSVATDRADWAWVFMGNPYFMIDQKMPKHRRAFIDPIPIPRYWHTIAGLGASINIVPLEFNKFNESKSNISWQEACLMGAATLAPDSPEWRRPGVTNYRDRREFKKKLSEMVKMPLEDLRALSNQGWEYLQQNENLWITSMQRMAIARRLQEIPQARYLKADTMEPCPVSASL
jgi:hypothetical protein